MRPCRRMLFIPIVVIGSLLAAGCDDGTSTQSGTEASTSTIRDQAQDGDRLQQAVDKVVSACQDRDRDRLRDLVQDQLRDRVRDMDMLGVCDGSVLQATIDDYSVAGETATVQVRLSIQPRNAEATELRETWRFRWEQEQWRLIELPSALTATTPSTLRAQDRDQSKS